MLFKVPLEIGRIDSVGLPGIKSLLDLDGINSYRRARLFLVPVLHHHGDGSSAAAILLLLEEWDIKPNAWALS